MQHPHRVRRAGALGLLLVVLLGCRVAPGGATASWSGDGVPADDAPFEVPDLAELLAGPGMPAVLIRYSADLGSLRRVHDVRSSPNRRRVLRRFFSEWRESLSALDFEALARDDRIDWHLFRNQLDYELRRLDLEDVRQAEIEPLIPFAPRIVELQEARRRLESVDPAAVATALTELTEQIGVLRADGGAAEVSRTVANRASGTVDDLRRTLSGWFRFHDGYDPLFSWWVGEPYRKVDRALDDYAKFLREKLAGVDSADRDTIVGDPIGRDALLAELASEMIPYSPEELFEIAEKEFDWCEREMRRASNDLGFGDDWLAALEHVKTLHVEPGGQTRLVRDLAFEAIDFLEERDLVTIPPLAKTGWRMEMMSPERQRVNPFFTGGEVISVSYPTDTMSHADKLMSMRGNNVHFSRAVVHHELIPGHYLQAFMNDRHRTYRAPFRTPFWTEGWALYWEMLLWDLGFARSAEDRVGMLFWRSHRCARILFSLGFHLERMTPEECVDLLVERVGHELANATAEVRRSFESSYGPLYQCAYMLGGLQFRALHAEAVGAGRMTDREFHDAVLRENCIPVEMVRAKILDRELGRDFESSWRFYD